MKAERVCKGRQRNRIEAERKWLEMELNQTGDHVSKKKVRKGNHLRALKLLLTLANRKTSINLTQAVSVKV